MAEASQSEMRPEPSTRVPNQLGGDIIESSSRKGGMAMRKSRAIVIYSSYEVRSDASAGSPTCQRHTAGNEGFVEIQ
jgi:hypothetical protein